MQEKMYIKEHSIQYSTTIYVFENHIVDFILSSAAISYNQNDILKLFEI